MSLSIEAMKLLRDKGLTIDDVIEVAEANVSHGVTSKPTSAARTRAYRARMSAARDASQPVTKPPASSPQRDNIKPPTTTPKSSLRSESVKIAERVFDDEFWKIYPRRVAKDAARKAFVKKIVTGRATAETILAGARALAAKSVGKDAEFIPHAATWLNAGGFDDEEPTSGGLIAASPTVSGSATASGGMWLHREDPRFEVWAAFKRSLGKQQPVDARGGWDFPSERPPQDLPKSAPQLRLIG